LNKIVIILPIRGAVNLGVSPCYQEIPNSINSDLQIDFTTFFKQGSNFILSQFLISFLANTKVAIVINYKLYSSVDNVKSVFDGYLGMSGLLVNQFLGFQNITNSNGIPVITTIVNVSLICIIFYIKFYLARNKYRTNICILLYFRYSKT
jgi:hypothetical protein